jgi:Mrp family chromosome partitioning ATPase
MWLQPPPADSLRALVLPQLEQMIAWAKSEFAWTLIDAPPGLTPEANLLAQLVDGILFVVDTGSTTYEAARRAIDNVGRDRIVGVAMNRAPQTGVDSALKYYQHAYPRSKRSKT